MIGRRLVILALLAAGCQEPRIDPDRPIDVSLIGRTPVLVDPGRRPLSEGDAVLLGAVAQGLVRFDAAGQIEAGLATRWDVSDDGLFYTFRLADGGGIDADDAARSLRRAVAPASRNPLRPILGAIDEIVAVTPEILEIRLSSPRPNLLALLAQPELAVLAGNGGGGPLRVVERAPARLLLAPVEVEAEPLDEEERTRRQVILRGERAALAVARFDAGQAGLVAGGRIYDLPIARARPPGAQGLRFDLASGLFGFAVARNGPFLVAPEIRRALAMAIDRDRLATLLAVPGWRVETGLVPGGTPELPQPSPAPWVGLAVADRVALARRDVAAWVDRNGAPPVLRVAIPDAPGTRMLFARVAADWRRIGVKAERVAPDAPADLRLLDEVAPADIASWYLRRFTCDRSPVCSEQADAALVAAREADTLARRAALLADADLRLADVAPFIPLGRPVRWSLVARGLDGWRENGRARHPLIHLRGGAR